MAVYVDDMRAPFGKLILCHMVASTDEELHAMADRIGVSRRWWQAPPKHSSHYDISLSKRAQAVKAGALEVSARQLAVMCRIRKQTGVLGSIEEANAVLCQSSANKKQPGHPQQTDLFN